MKTIGIIKKDFHTKGGLEKASLRIIEEFQKHGSVTLLTACHATGPCPVLTCSLRSRSHFRQLQEFDSWCRIKAQIESYDVVLSMDRCSYQTHHRAGNGVHAAYLHLRRKEEGVLKRFSFALNPLHRVMLDLEKKTFEDPHLQGIIVNSHMVKDQILEFYNTPPEKIHVIHNGVEWKEMETPFHAGFSERENIAHSLGLDPSKFQFLFIGHNFKRKGLTPLLTALSHLKTKDFHLSVIGTDKNLPLYKRQAADQNVTFFGPQNPLPFYQVADCLVIPSLYDPFANVTVEALAMGLFVISSKNNGGHEVLTPESGIACDSLDTALLSALSHPKNRFTAQTIRDSVMHLDFAHQLEKVVAVCLS